MKFVDIIKNSNVVVHCSTEEQANRLLNEANSYGLKWIGFDSYINHNKYHIYKNETCYNLNSGTFAYKQFYQNRHNTIVIEFDDVEFSNLNREQTNRIIEMAKREGLSIDEFLNRVDEILMDPDTSHYFE